MTTTDGIEAVFLETRNWGKAATFFQALGYQLDFETDHNSGQLRRIPTSTVVSARASATPFIGFYAPEEMLAITRDAGFDDVRHVSSAMNAVRYFGNRSDGLRPSTGEDILLATT